VAPSFQPPTHEVTTAPRLPRPVPTPVHIAWRCQAALHLTVEEVVTAIASGAREGPDCTTITPPCPRVRCHCSRFTTGAAAHTHPALTTRHQVTTLSRAPVSRRHVAVLSRGIIVDASADARPCRTLVHGSWQILERQQRQQRQRALDFRAAAAAATNTNTDGSSSGRVVDVEAETKAEAEAEAEVEVEVEVEVGTTLVEAAARTHVYPVPSGSGPWWSPTRPRSRASSSTVARPVTACSARTLASRPICVVGVVSAPQVPQVPQVREQVLVGVSGGACYGLDTGAATRVVTRPVIVPRHWRVQWLPAIAHARRYCCPPMRLPCLQVRHPHPMLTEWWRVAEIEGETAARAIKTASKRRWCLRVEKSCRAHHPVNTGGSDGTSHSTAATTTTASMLRRGVHVVIMTAHRSDPVAILCQKTGCAGRNRLVVVVVLLLLVLAFAASATTTTCA